MRWGRSLLLATGMAVALGWARALLGMKPAPVVSVLAEAGGGATGADEVQAWIEAWRNKGASRAGR